MQHPSFDFTTQQFDGEDCVEYQPILNSLPLHMSLKNDVNTK
jgi:hypothetical protein